MSSNDYFYEDLNGIYTDLSTGVMWNKLNLSDANDLSVAEHIIVGERLILLQKKPLIISSTKELFKIHKILFSEVYSWAGQLRKVNISKQGKQFFPVQSFDNGLNYIDGLISKYIDTDKDDISKMSAQLALILDSINYLHPFREGEWAFAARIYSITCFAEGLQY